MSGIRTVIIINCNTCTRAGQSDSVVSRLREKEILSPRKGAGAVGDAIALEYPTDFGENSVSVIWSISSVSRQRLHYVHFICLIKIAVSKNQNKNQMYRLVPKRCRALFIFKNAFRRNFVYFYFCFNNSTNSWVPHIGCHLHNL